MIPVSRLEPTPVQQSPKLKPPFFVKEIRMAFDIRNLTKEIGYLRMATNQAPTLSTPTPTQPTPEVRS